jgi:hypothetical protein
LQDFDDYERLFQTQFGTNSQVVSDTGQKTMQLRNSLFRNTGQFKNQPAEYCNDRGGIGEGARRE